ncbi:conserved hypothetical protein [Bradyrhizobium sp. STM 3843]|uniref:hypothetical protein n=1 Tax=Bradyrhizobium sp. STM 3843 TaxID=551947 RepID=UPI000240A939|nr:hypothetical protein [Bradyrhizobium sp. STM 3843]CCE06125.1 conserved hypothetical protein [Bradyrhizobium sp. STM 3843]
MAQAGPSPSNVQTTLELRDEEDQLRKSDADIAAGWTRLLRQECLLRDLKVAGKPFQEAERLVALLRDTLTEWERHRTLIEQRIAYLRERRAQGS